MESLYSFWIELFDKRSFLKQGLGLAGLDCDKEMIFVSDHEDYRIAPLVITIPIEPIFTDKYFLVRGRKAGFQKVCLIHESFLGGVSAEYLSSEMFSQIIDENLTDVDKEEKELIKSAVSFQKVLSRVGRLKKSSVTLKYQVEIEVKPQSNIFDPDYYPEILDDTLNLVCPFHSETEKEDLIEKMDAVVGAQRLGELKILQIKHPFNGWFLVFQAGL
ncbi:MAG: hypothetical protein DPW18_06720 [Chloroflexi bacterium]|nr:hypothetical protein [Chloroflexota bacterium]MDL1942180.1 hypothetical protein [Chloroflexi bacterium CFX2]